MQTHAGDLYQKIVLEGAISGDDPRIVEDAPEHEAFAFLVDLGLLAFDPATDSYLPVDPATVQSRVVSPMGQRAAELLAESTDWANTFAELGLVYRRTSRSEQPIVELRGLPNINRFLTAAVGDAEFELLTAQPDGARPADVLAEAIERDKRALQRGLRMRTLYQHSARRSVATRQYVEEVIKHGAEVRTLDEFFNRLIVVDRRLAIVPGVEGYQVALAIHDAGLVAYLVDIFERYWERARGFTDRELNTEREVADDVHNMTVRMLVEGHSDNASAKRMGVSTRTYAGYVASLKAEYGVETRFQLGYAIGRQEERERHEQRAAAASEPD
ncbi:LuxR family transcriptional regulator [Nocardioides pocheonensis]|uniref:LuxR family transcriptional regulator n=1 Tax=Nocardioides pocheonensis TaxID=661485 RepID=A0A3N0GKD7_9ACTN|nr:LuxR family transcriptional regulator [Nocardioides pocheonensis]